jgi:hypothetical protein
MPPTEPGAAELMRGIEKLDQAIRDLRVDLAHDYVRKEVQDARERTTDVQIGGIEDELHAMGRRIDAHKNEATRRVDKIEERTTATWRLTLTALIFPLLVAAIIFLAHAAVTN